MTSSGCAQGNRNLLFLCVLQSIVSTEMQISAALSFGIPC